MPANYLKGQRRKILVYLYTSCCMHDLKKYFLSILICCLYTNDYSKESKPNYYLDCVRTQTVQMYNFFIRCLPSLVTIYRLYTVKYEYSVTVVYYVIHFIIYSTYCTVYWVKNLIQVLYIES